MYFLVFASVMTGNCTHAPLACTQKLHVYQVGAIIGCNNSGETEEVLTYPKVTQRLLFNVQLLNPAYRKFVTSCHSLVNA